MKRWIAEEPKLSTRGFLTREETRTTRRAGIHNGIGTLLRRLVLNPDGGVAVVPVAEGAAKVVEGLAPASAELIPVFPGKKVQDVILLIPSSELVAVPLMGAPPPGPSVDFIEIVKVGQLSGVLILIAETLKYIPQIPCAFEPEVIGIEIPVEVFPHRGSDEIGYLTRIFLADVLGNPLNIPAKP